MSTIAEDDSRYPKIFLIFPNSALIPPEDCLPYLFQLGLDAHYMDRRIGLSERAFIEDIFLRVNIAFELFPKSIFLFNVSINKIGERQWLQFLGLIKRLSTKEDHPIHMGLIHETSLLTEETYRTICTNNLLIRFGTNIRDNIANLATTLKELVQERRKFPRFLCHNTAIDIHITCRVESCLYCAKVYDLSTGHFSCFFQGSTPVIPDYEKINNLILSIGRYNYPLPAVFQQTRNIMNPESGKAERLFVFSFNGGKSADPAMIKRINMLVFRWSQKNTKDMIEEKRQEYLTARQEMAELQRNMNFPQ